MVKQISLVYGMALALLVLVGVAAVVFPAFSSYVGFALSHYLNAVTPSGTAIILTPPNPI